MTRVERETIVAYNQQDEEATVMTHDPSLKRKLDKLCEERPDDIQMTLECKGSKNYIFPKKWIKITPPRKSNLTDEQKAAAAERLHAARNKKVKK